MLKKINTMSFKNKQAPYETKELLKISGYLNNSISFEEHDEKIKPFLT
jgi:hypothetical protein